MVHCESVAQWRRYEGVGVSLPTVCGKWRFQQSIRRNEIRNAFLENVLFLRGGSQFMRDINRMFAYHVCIEFVEEEVTEN